MNQIPYQIPSYEQALQIIRDNVPISQIYYKNLIEAIDECIAEDIYADRDLPPFNQAGMEGMALRYSDFSQGEKKYKIVANIEGGKRFDIKVHNGECVHIPSGACVPDGLDLLIRIEDCKVEGDEVVFNSQQVRKWQNINIRGTDAREGQLVLKKGSVLNNVNIGIAAGVGQTPIQVYPKPTVAIIATGNEVVPVVQVPSAFEIRNSNAYSLQAYLKDYLIDVLFYSVAPHETQGLQNTLDKALNAQIVIITGGFSNGDEYMAKMLTSLGVEEVFHEVNIKPGRPVWFGKKGNESAVFGLSGNPVSCQLLFKAFVEPYIRKVMGYPLAQPMYLPLFSELEGVSECSQFVLGRVILEKNKSFIDRVHYNHNGDFINIQPSHGYFLMPEGIQKLEKGVTVPFYFWKSW